MKNTLDKVRVACAPISERMGFELAGVTFEDEPGFGQILVLYIYSENGVTIDDCERVSREVEPIIDEIDPFSDAYSLSVSSLGLERQFKTTRDYERYLQKNIEIKFYRAIELEELSGEEKPIEIKKKKSKKKKDKEFVVLLTEVSDNSIKIELEDREYSITRDLIARARPALK